MLVGVAATTVAWFAVTFLAPATDAETLEAFVARVRPGGPGWRAVTARMPAALRPAADGDLWTALVATVASTIATWAALFAVGLLLYGQVGKGGVAAIVAIAGGLVVRSCWNRLVFH